MINGSHSPPAHESHLSPSKSKSENKPGGWRAIKYILGNILSFHAWLISFYFAMMELMFVYVLKETNRSRNWHP